MSRLRWALIAGGLFGGGFAVYGLTRQAHIQRAIITSITSDNLPTASIAITYTQGMPPVSVIIDIIENDRSKGSATIGGKQLFVDIPLHTSIGKSYIIVTTAYWRSPRGMVRHIQYHSH
ncbi:MAG: hypothetical protein AAGF95_05435 [Chloroflexota bacterium]